MVWSCYENGRVQNTKNIGRVEIRPRGRPRSRCINNVRRDLERRGAVWDKVCERRAVKRQR